jgi:plastocyanin
VAGAGLITGDGSRALAAENVQAQAGGGEAGIAVNVFSPDSIAVTVGDTVTWTNPYTEPHSVAFVAGDDDIQDPEGPLNPEAAASFDGTETFSSGLFAASGMFGAGGNTFSVTFEKAGAYEFFCTIHAGMVVDVTVTNGGFTPPVDQDRIDQRVDEGVQLGLAAANAITVPAPKAAAGGGQEWTIPTPPSVPYQGGVVDVLRFTPAEVNIAAGDTVTWENDSFTPHTVTFLNGPPPADFDPFTAADVTSTYTPGSFLNSGLIANPGLEAAAGFPVAGDSFSLKFNTPGDYQYICALHADSGMVGVIHVGTSSGDNGGSNGGTSGGGTVTPPNTGDAGLKADTSGSWMMMAGIAMLLSSIAAGAFVVVHKDE